MVAAILLASFGPLAAYSLAAPPASAREPAPTMVAATSPAAEPRANEPPASALSPTISLAEGYVLGVGDVVEVAVLGREEFHPRVQVQNDGTIQLPYLHSVPAQNLTVLQLRDRVRKLLQAGGFYTDPVVNVQVVTFASRYVTVLGEVGSPGLLPIDRSYRLSEVLARVGGLRAGAEDEVLVRHANGGEQRLVASEVAAGGAEQDPVVSPGDKVYVAVAPSFYIYGQVAQPGSYKVERGMTLRMAIARGGGLNERGSEKKIKLFRDGKEMARVDLNQPVKGGDTVVVGERFF